MSEQIVSCPGCGKRYAVPGGAPPGQFQCEDCSAVVAYGPSPTAQAPRVAGHARTARSGGGGRRRRRGGRRRREEIVEEERGGRRRGGAAKKEKDATPYLLAIVAVGLLGVIGLMLANQGDEGGSKSGGGDRAASSASGLSASDLPAALPGRGGPAEALGSGLMDGDPDAPFRDEPADTSLGPGAISKSGRRDGGGSVHKMAEVLPKGGNYGKGSLELRALVRRDRAAVVQELDHLPDTPEEQKAEIDGLVAVMADATAGREALDAERSLVEIGRAAVPRMLSAVAKYDFESYGSMVEARDACIVADAVDRGMRSITGKTNITHLQYTHRGELRVYSRVIENWFVWWLNTGYEYAEYPKAEAAVEDEGEL